MGIMERLSGAFGPRVAERPLELVRGPKRWPLGPVTRRVQAHVAQFLAS